MLPSTSCSRQNVFAFHSGAAKFGHVSHLLLSVISLSFLKESLSTHLEIPLIFWEVICLGQEAGATFEIIGYSLTIPSPVSWLCFSLHDVGPVSPWEDPSLD